MKTIKEFICSDLFIILVVAICYLSTFTFSLLRVADVIKWSWWWVLSPILIPFTLILIGLAVFAIFKPFKHV